MLAQPTAEAEHPTKPRQHLSDSLAAALGMVDMVLLAGSSHMGVLARTRHSCWRGGSAAAAAVAIGGTAAAGLCNAAAVAGHSSGLHSSSQGRLVLAAGASCSGRQEQLSHEVSMVEEDWAWQQVLVCVQHESRKALLYMPSPCAGTSLASTISCLHDFMHPVPSNLLRHVPYSQSAAP